MRVRDVIGMHMEIAIPIIFSEDCFIKIRTYFSNVQIMFQNNQKRNSLSSTSAPQRSQQHEASREDGCLCPESSASHLPSSKLREIPASDTEEPQNSKWREELRAGLSRLV